MKKFFALVVVLIFAGGMSLGQATSVNGGAIQGTITDPTGAIIPGADVTITGTNTGSVKVIKTDSAGFYSVGPLIPGSYNVTITMAGFQKLSVNTFVRTGTATNGNYELTIGSSEQTIEVNAGALQINTDQAGVQDVLTKQQVESLPINGRNFLDLAQIQPGVILQAGEGFDPTKAGYSAISVDGVSGRTTRILYDGQDITDETVGTTIVNVPTGAVDEFQLNRSTQDVSGEVTSTGQVLVSSPSGTNIFHGQAFYQFQDNNALYARAFGGFNEPFQRNQFGGSFGGPIIKDKLFFFGDIERIKQDQANVAQASPTFASILAQYPTFPTPFRDTFSQARLDYSGPFQGHYFVRAFYEVNADAGNYNNLYQLYTNRDNVPGLGGGADYSFGHWTHSFRGSYEKFHNLIVDDTAGNTSIYNPNLGLNLADGPDGFYAGPNLLAPQGTFQSDKQLRYDGTWTHGRHTVKFGASLNRILGGGFAAFFSLAPQVGFDQNSILTQCADPSVQGSCAGDPVSGYNLAGGVTFGNGNGVFTEKPGFGLPGGGQEDWRSAYYVADTWKATTSLTVVAGLRYSIDTDRANQDLPVPTCADAIANGFTLSCSGNTSLFTQFDPSLTQSHVHQPYGNFGPQVGFVFSPGSHKMSLRGGIGIYYENDIFNNTGNSRPAVLNANGPFFGNAGICGAFPTFINAPGGVTITSGTANGTTLPISSICSLSIGQAAPYLTNIYSQYRDATVANNDGPNGSFVAGLLGFSPTYGTQGAYAPNYLTPYSIQWNGGIQYQVAHGTILSVDYIHNTTLKISLIRDLNRVGAANTFNLTAAQNAVLNTLAPNAATQYAGYPQCPQNYSSAAITCAIAAGATIADFAAQGLDSGGTFLGGVPAQVLGLTPATGAAFPGTNTAVGQGQLSTPTGQSGYDALQIVLKQQRSNPVPGIASANFQLSYSLSRIVSDAGFGGTSSIGTSDQFFNSFPVDNDDPKSYMGRNSNDHSNEVSFGGSFLVKHGPQVGIIGHFFSAGASTLTLPVSGAPGEIFRTDVTGDGTTGDLLPGTEVGAYMHQVKPKNLAAFVNNYNNTRGNGQTFTPAGQALVASGLFTASQLVAAGGVEPTLNSVPSNGSVANPAFRDFDASVSYPISLSRLREGFSLVPGISFYNVFNMANYGRLTGDLINSSTPGASSASALNGGNTFPILNSLRTERGSGTFAQGSPRTTEFQLKLNF